MVTLVIQGRRYRRPNERRATAGERQTQVGSGSGADNGKWVVVVLVLIMGSGW